MERYRILNNRQYDIGLRLQNGTDRVVKAGSYTLLEKDEIAYLASVAPALFMEERQLRLEDRTLSLELGFIQDVNMPLFGEAEIRKHLSGTVGKMRAWLETITEPYLLDEVMRVAAAMDLPASKLQVLQERAPERDLITADL